MADEIKKFFKIFGSVKDSFTNFLKHENKGETDLANEEREKPAVSQKKQEPKKSPRKIEFLPVLVDKFDDLLEDNGLERGSTILISGGAGTGKTTFALQSIYHGALKGEKGLFLSFEEEPEKVKRHMLKNFGWDFYKLEKEGKVAFLKLDPAKIARSVESIIAKKTGSLKIKVREIEFPLKPDRICVDSLSSLSIAFEEEENYRKYIRELFELLESYNSVNFMISETEQNPKIYSKTGVEEFLADGVVVFYNLKVAEFRKNALEILKMRAGRHIKRMVPYKMTKDGFELEIPKDASF